MVTNGWTIQRPVDKSLDVIAEEMAHLYNAVEGYDNPDFQPKDATFFEEMYASLNLEKDLVLAWNPEGHLDGMARIYQMGASAIGVSVNVRPSRRDEGIGSRLFDEILKEAKSRKYTKIRTVVPSYRPDSIALAKSKGFERVDTKIRMETEITDDLFEDKENTRIQITEIKSENQLDIWKDLQDSIFVDSPTYEPISEDALATFQKKPGFIGIIAYLDNEPIGYCVGWKTNPSNFFVFGIGIVEGYHHRGYGTMLLTNALREAKKQGMSKSNLFVEADNDQAISFYKKRFNYKEKYRRIYFEMDN
ncbi:MAG: GNAT family N-acetyltransferase [Candidatus Thorarchaeota archaeon]|nr:GNAT family N-acetyltransferase [Candidatus Thorarchaeota archaeon]